MVRPTLLRSIADVYDAALDPSLWPSCLTGVSDLFGGTSTQLLFHDHTAHRGGVQVSVKCAPEALDAYVAHYHAKDPWALSSRWLDLRPGDVCTDEQLIEYSAMRKTEFYAVYRRFDIARAIAVALSVGGAPLRSSVLAINRNERQRPFGEREVSMLRTLTPHVRRALAVHRRLATIDMQVTSALDAFDRAEVGLVALGAGGAVVFANRSALVHARAGGGLAIGPDGVRAASPSASEALDVLIAGAAAVASGRSIEGGGTLALPRADGSPLQVLVTPVSGCGPFPVAGAAVLLVIRDPDQPPTLEASALQAMFGLTPAEAGAAASLASGTCTKELSRQLRVTPATARWLVERIRMKTGSATQAQAVGRLTASLARVPASGQS